MSTTVAVTHADREVERAIVSLRPYVANIPSQQGKTAARYRIACQAELLAALEAMVAWANSNGAGSGYPGAQVASAIKNAKAAR